MSKHVMMYEGRGSKKRKAVKTPKKRSAVSRQLQKGRRQAENVLGAIGLMVVIFVLFRLMMMGG